MVCMGTDTFTPRQFTRVGLYLTVIGYLLLLLFAATVENFRSNVRKPTMSLQIAVEKVRWLAAGLLELNGCDADIAQDVAEHMIEAERYGCQPRRHAATEISGK